MDAQGPEREVIDGPDRKGRQEVPEESADLLLAPIYPVLGQESRIVVIVRFSHQESAPARRVRSAPLVRAATSRWRRRSRLLGAGPATRHLAPPLAHAPDLQ